MSSHLLQWRSLKTRVTLFTLVIFVISIWSLTFYISRLLQDDMRRVLGEQQFATVSFIAEEFNSSLTDRLSSLELIAKEVDADLMSHPVALQARLEQRPLLQILFNGGTFITSSDGKAIASIPASVGRIGVSYLDRDFVVAALREGKSTIGRPVMGKLLNSPIVVMAVPIRDFQGKLIGALAAVTDLGKPNFLDQIAQSHYGQSGSYLLISPQHKLIVTATDKSRIMLPVPAPGINAMHDRYMQGYEGFGVAVSSRGVTELSAAKGIPVAGWFVAAVLPAEIAFAPVEAMLRRMLLGALVATLLTGALAWWIITRMLQHQLAPMLEASRTLATLSSSDQPVRALPVSSQDEIGELIGCFNQLLKSSAKRELALAESEERWKFAIEGAGDGLWDWNTQTGKAFYSPRYKEMFGYAETDIGDTADEWSKRIHPDDAPGVMAALQPYMEGKPGSAAVEFRMICKDGSWKWTLGRGMVVSRDVDGKPLRMIGTNTDITERKEAEESLDETRQKYRALSEAAFEAIFISEKGRCLEQNQRAEQMFGYTEAEALGRFGTEWIVPEDRDRVMNNMMSGYELPYEVTGLCKDSSTFPAVIRGKMMHYKGRSVRVTSMSDITELKKVEAALRDNEEQLRAITDNTTAVIVLKDMEGRYLHVNRRFEELFHMTCKQMIGRTDYDVFPSDLAEKFAKNDQVAIQSGRSFEVEELVQQSDGLHTYISVKFPLRKNSGEIYAICGIATDISERKQAEQDLRVAATTFESQEGMMIVDGNGVILKVNRAFVDITGFTAEEAVGRTPKFLSSGRHDQDFYSAMWKSIERTGAWQGEIWNRRKSGDVYPEWLMITAVKDEVGRTTHYVGTFTDVTLRKKADVEIANLAFYDPLTGLPNRRLLLDRLKQAIASSIRNARYGALLFLDLDNFKTLNDTRGHDIGDMLLQQVAQRLVTCVREGDTVARLGGDEFVLMLEDLNDNAIEAATQTEAVGEKILAALNQTYHLAEYAHRSTPSIGVTLFINHQGQIDDLLKRADLAMYQAKAAGRNTLRFFDPEMQAVVMTRAALEADLNEAVLKKQFLLYYQAQVDYKGSPTGVEVLVRWQHPLRGLVSPLEFIPLAEETGLILPLGHWVLQTACAQLALWATRPEMAHVTVAVNVSARQLRLPNFVEEVMRILDHSRANPQRLKLELTESLLVADVEDTITKMNALKAIGVGFSLDDFGTGFSSLSYLKRLPLDQLKIDQSFVRNVLTDPNDAAIAKMVVALAESMGLAVIAEGVEIEAQKEFLAHNGCNAYQGYLFSRPLPIEEFEEFMKCVD